MITVLVFCAVILVGMLTWTAILAFLDARDGSGPWRKWFLWGLRDVFGTIICAPFVFGFIALRWLWNNGGHLALLAVNCVRQALAFFFVAIALIFFGSAILFASIGFWFENRTDEINESLYALGWKKRPDYKW